MTLFAGLEGNTVPPGDYLARISVDGQLAETRFSLLMDPRKNATQAELAEWIARLDETSSLLDDILTGLGGLREARNGITELMQEYPDRTELQQRGQAALDAIEAWDYRIIQPLHETLEDEDAWETMLAGQVRFLMDVIDSTGAPVTEGAMTRLADLKAEWAALENQLAAIRSDHIEPLNRWARENSVPHISSGTD